MSLPRWLRWLTGLLPRRHRRAITDDLLDEYEEAWLPNLGPGRAACRLLLETARAVLWSTLLRIRTLPRHRARPVPSRAWAAPERGLEEATGARRLEMLAVDVGHAFRRLVHDPGLALVATVSLGLGIGTGTAVFSVVQAVLLRPLPYPEAHRLVQLGHAALDGSFGITAHTASNYVVWKESATSFRSMAAYAQVSRSLTGPDRDAELLRGVTSIGSIFDVLQVAPARGRLFTEEEDRPGPDPIVVVSHALSQRVFGDGDPIGRSLVLGGRPYEIVGVTPPGFAYPTPDTQFWIPEELGAEALSTGTDWSYRTVARLEAGRTVHQAAQEMAAIAARLRQVAPEANENVKVDVVPLRELMVRNVRALLWMLSGTVAIVLVIACLNLVNLLLSRSVARAPEMALRRALGASEGRVLRQVLVESGILALLGAASGLAVGWVSIRGLVRWMPWSLPRGGDIRMDSSVVAFALLLAGIAALLSGGAPARRLARAPVQDRLRLHGRGATASRSSRGLVIVEVALSVMLLVGAGLLTRSFAKLTRVDPGFEVENRVMFGLFLPDDSPVEGRVPFFGELERRLARLPGVESVGITTAVPVFSWGSSTRVETPDSPVPEALRSDAVAYRVVSPGYLEAMGIRLLGGRHLSRQDGQDGVPSVVISEAMARAFWPGQDALGRTTSIGLWPTPGGSGRGWLPPATVVGIVEDVRLYGLAREPQPTVYLVHEMVPYRGRFQVVLHVDGDLPGVMGSIRGVVRGLDPDLPVFALSELRDILAASVSSQRGSMTLLGVLGAVALLTAMIGVHGVLSFLVSGRRREIGIRMALGADGVRVRLGVLRTALADVVCGLALGLAGALSVTHFMESLLFQVSPADPATLVGISLLLLAAAVPAAYLPARRATLVDPVTVLAAE